MNITDPSVEPPRYFARFYYIDPDEEGPDNERDEEVFSEDDQNLGLISLREAVLRAHVVSALHPRADRYEVVERTRLHWDCGWDWTSRPAWEEGDPTP